MASDEPDYDPMAPTEPVYPATAIGTLTQQRDQILATAAQDEGMAVIYTDRAKAGRDRAAQLQAAIDVMPPDAA